MCACVFECVARRTPNEVLVVAATEGPARLLFFCRMRFSFSLVFFVFWLSFMLPAFHNTHTHRPQADSLTYCHVYISLSSAGSVGQKKKRERHTKGQSQRAKIKAKAKPNQTRPDQAGPSRAKGPESTVESSSTRFG